MMNEINEIWKKRTGADLTEEEAWKMLAFVKMLFENADRNIQKASEEKEV